MAQEPSTSVNSGTGAGALGKRLILFPLDCILKDEGLELLVVILP